MVQRVRQPQRRRSGAGRRTGVAPAGTAGPAAPASADTVQPSGANSRVDQRRARPGRAAPGHGSPAAAPARPARAGRRSGPAIAVRKTRPSATASMRGRRVRPVVDVLRRARTPSGPPNRRPRTSADRVDLEQQRRRAPRGGGLGIEHVRRADRHVEASAPGPGACAAGSPGRSPERRVEVMVTNITSSCPTGHVTSEAVDGARAELLSATRQSGRTACGRGTGGWSRRATACC